MEWENQQNNPQTPPASQPYTVESLEAEQAAQQATPQLTHIQTAPQENDTKAVYEYEQEFQREGILQKYRRAYQRILRNLGILSALTVLALLYECLHDSAMPSFLSPSLHPIRYILINDLLWIAGIFCIFDSFVKGIKALFSSKPQPQSLLGLLVTVTLLYQIGGMIGWQVQKNALGAADLATVIADPLAKFSPIQPAALFLLFFCLGIALLELMELRREVYAFDQMSAKGEKTVLCQNENGYATRRASFFSGFYRNGLEYPTQHRCIYYYFGGLLIIWVLFFFLYLGRVGAWDGLRCAYVSLMMATPTSLLFLFAFPQFRLAHSLYQKDAMVLSEQTVTRVATAQNVELSDRTVLDAAKVQMTDLRIYGNYPLDRALYYLGSALSKLDCTMSASFCRSIQEMGHSQTVSVLDFGNGGVCTMVDGNVLVEFGTAAYLQSKRYNVPTDTEAPSKSVLAYLAIDSRIVATLRANYALKESFLRRLPAMAKQNLTVTVRTADPLLQMEILAALLPADCKAHLALSTVEKPQELAQICDRLDGVAMTTGEDEMILLDTMLRANDIYLSTKKHQFTVCVFMILSLFGMAALQNSCIDGILHAKVLVPILYQLLCNVGMAGLLWLDDRQKGRKSL